MLGVLVDDEVLGVHSLDLGEEFLVEFQVVEDLEVVGELCAASLFLELELSHLFSSSELLQSLFFLLGINFILPLGELLEDVVKSHAVPSGPLVGPHLLHCVPVLDLGQQHVVDQILELLREESLGFLSGMGIPEHWEVLAGEHLVVRISVHSLLEWWAAGVEDEEDDTGSEEIDVGSIVVPCSDFGGHVPLSSQLGVELTSFEVGGETEVGDF